MKKILLSLLLLFCAGNTFAQTQAEKDSIAWEKAFALAIPSEELSEKFIDGIKQGLEEFTSSLELDTAEHDSLIKRIADACTPTILKTTHDYYKQYFSTEELLEIAKFNNTPLGKKIKLHQTQLVLEIAKESREMGETIVAPILQELIETKSMEQAAEEAAEEEGE